MKKNLSAVASLAAQFAQMAPKKDDPKPEKAKASQTPEEKIQAIVMDLTDIDREEYVKGADLKEDFAMDSLDMIELVMICEKEFRISIADMEWMKIRTVKELEIMILGRIAPANQKVA
ncbi:MAG: phosphopantetheine-binding protein [Bacteroidota bacterium]